MNMELTLELIQLGLVLIICGLLLSSWEPPIKSQYKFLILLEKTCPRMELISQ